jgi:hypothetical protein
MAFADTRQTAVSKPLSAELWLDTPPPVEADVGAAFGDQHELTVYDALQRVVLAAASAIVEDDDPQGRERSLGRKGHLTQKPRALVHREDQPA